MDSSALDAFFAQADDVLTDWNGSLDSVDTANPDNLEDEVGLTAAQAEAMATASRQAVAAVQAMADAVGKFAVAFHRALENAAAEQAELMADIKP